MTLSNDELAVLKGEPEAKPEHDPDAAQGGTKAAVKEVEPPVVLTKGNLGGLKVEPVAAKDNWINILIYGESGVGKTTLAGSASTVPDMAPVLIVDVEGGSLSLRDRYPNVSVVRVQRWEDMQTVLNELIMSKGGGFRTVVIDSLTEIQAFNMRFVMRQLKDRDASRDEDIPGMQEWGKNLVIMQRLIRGFRDLPVHTIFTALLREERDKNGRPIKKPALQGQIGGQVPAFVDIVGFYYIKKIEDELKRLLLVSKTDDTIAKDRSGKLPTVVMEPTMQDIWQHVMANTNT